MHVEYHPDFSEDLMPAAEYLEDEQKGLGDRFLNEVESTCRALIAEPTLNSYIDKPVRRRLVKPFSYAVHFEVIDEECLFIYGCYHCSMNPSRWTGRYD